MSELPEPNAAEARRSLAHAREDLLTAERIARDVELPARLACFLSQLAAEKALKAYVISLGIPFRKVHDLRELFALLPTEISVAPAVRDLDLLNPWVTEGRYPGDAPAATQTDADELKATSPLRPMPLAMLTHGKSFVLPKDPALSQGFTSKQIEPILLKANKAQAKLVPDARFFTAKENGHDIHQDQPALTAEAIQQVVAGVRSPDTWYSLQTCCRT